MKAWIAAFAGAAVAVLAVTTVTAGAATTPVFPGAQGTTAAYGFDGNAHLIVGGGSDTTYRVMQSLTDLWGGSASASSALCATNKGPVNFPSGSPYPPSTPVLNQCSPAAQTFSPANYDADTATNADPAGSSAGIASLNGNNGGTAGTYAYEGTNQTLSASDGTHNGLGTVDYARSSRAPKLTGGNCALTGPAPNNFTNDELACDTFWGFAEDGVEVTLFDGRTTQGINLTPAQIDGIWNCTITDWNQINSSIPAGTPIVPWAMNTSSGTYATFNSWVAANANDPSFAADNNAVPNGRQCVRTLANPALTGNEKNPFENDIKSFVNDGANFSDDRPASVGGGAAAGLTSSATSTQNPENWIWFSSFGLLSHFTFDSAVSATNPNGSPNPFPVTSGAATVNGIAPSQSSIQLNRYPLNRTLYYVTKKSDADCPTNPNQALSTTSTLNPLSCDFTSNSSAAPTPYCNAVNNPNGQAELDVITSADTYSTVNGCRTPTQTGTTGVSGAVREFSRFLCRSSSDASGTDPFTGNLYNSEITAALGGSGFTQVPTALRSPGSSCEVLSQG